MRIIRMIAAAVRSAMALASLHTPTLFLYGRGLRVQGLGLNAPTPEPETITTSMRTPRRRDMHFFRRSVRGMSPLCMSYQNKT